MPLTGGTNRLKHQSTQRRRSTTDQEVVLERCRPFATVDSERTEADIFGALLPQQPPTSVLVCCFSSPLSGDYHLQREVVPYRWFRCRRRRCLPSPVGHFTAGRALRNKACSTGQLSSLAAFLCFRTHNAGGATNTTPADLYPARLEQMKKRNPHSCHRIKDMLNHKPTKSHNIL